MHKFTTTENLSDDDLKSIIDIWESHRQAINETRYFTANVLWKGRIYQVDGGWKTVKDVTEGW